MFGSDNQDRFHQGERIWGEKGERRGWVFDVWKWSDSLGLTEIIQPQLQQLIRMLNLGILFRITLPFSTAFNHILHNERIQPYKLPQLNKLYPLAESPLKNQSIPLSECDRFQPQLNLTPISNKLEKDQEDLETSNQENTFALIPFLTEKSNFGNRIKTLQYEANNPCEDRMVFGQLNTINAYTVSIFDGHGGPQLAEYSKQNINNFIDRYLKDNASINFGKDISDVLREALTQSYRKLQETYYVIYQKQLKQGNKKIKNVGTCAITAIVYNDKVYVGNAGDSQGIFIVSDPKSSIRTQKMNQRLNVNNKIERQRIIQKWKDKDSQIVVEDSNNSYYLKGRLQPTRTIGDYYLKKEDHFNGQGSFNGPYLSCEPDIKEYKLTKNHQYMVIASDGVWDVLSKNEVMNSLVEERQIDINKTLYEQEREEAPYLSNILSNILERSSELAGKSLEELKKMEKGKRRSYHDDITIAVVSLQNEV